MDREVRGHGAEGIGDYLPGDIINRGGPRSGNWGHRGIPGHRGGSMPKEGGPEDKVSASPVSRVQKAMDEWGTRQVGENVNHFRKGWIAPDGTIYNIYKDGKPDPGHHGDWGLKVLQAAGVKPFPATEPGLNVQGREADYWAVVRTFNDMGFLRVFNGNNIDIMYQGLLTSAQKDSIQEWMLARQASDDRYGNSVGQLEVEYAPVRGADYQYFSADFPIGGDLRDMDREMRRALQVQSLAARSLKEALFFIPLADHDELASAAAEVGRRLRATAIGGLPVPQEELHCTLVYLDSATDQAMAAVIARLRLPLPFNLRTLGLGIMGNCVVCFIDPDPTLLRLQRDVWSACKMQGGDIAFDSNDFSSPRNYKPHFSLATDLPEGIRIEDLGLSPELMGAASHDWRVHVSRIAACRENFGSTQTIRLPGKPGDRLFVEQSGQHAWDHRSQPRRTPIEVSGAEYAALAAGGIVFLSRTRRMVTLADGPFAIRGGPGSGYFAHEGRPGYVGGSVPGNSKILITHRERPFYGVPIGFTVHDMRTGEKWHYDISDYKRLLAEHRDLPKDEVAVLKQTVGIREDKPPYNPFPIPEPLRPVDVRPEGQAAQPFVAPGPGSALGDTLVALEAHYGHSREDFQKKAEEAFHIADWKAGRIYGQGGHERETHGKSETWQRISGIRQRQGLAFHQQLVDEAMRRYDEAHSGVKRGGPGSGFYDHAGRPGTVGGSAPGDRPAAQVVPSARGSARADDMRGEMPTHVLGAHESGADAYRREVEAQRQMYDRSAIMATGGPKRLSIDESERLFMPFLEQRDQTINDAYLLKAGVQLTHSVDIRLFNQGWQIWNTSGAHDHWRGRNKFYPDTPEGRNEALNRARQVAWAREPQSLVRRSTENEAVFNAESSLIGYINRKRMELAKRRYQDDPRMREVWGIDFRSPDPDMRMRARQVWEWRGGELAMEMAALDGMFGSDEAYVGEHNFQMADRAFVGRDDLYHDDPRVMFQYHVDFQSQDPATKGMSETLWNMHGYDIGRTLAAEDALNAEAIPKLAEDIEEAKALAAQSIIVQKQAAEAMGVQTSESTGTLKDSVDRIGDALEVLARKEEPAPQFTVVAHMPQTPVPFVTVTNQVETPQVTVVNEVQPAPQPVTVNLPEIAPVIQVDAKQDQPPVVVQNIVDIPTQPVNLTIETADETTETEVVQRDSAGRLLKTITHRIRNFVVRE